MIEVEAKAREKVPVKLGGVQYDILPPKWALSMKMAVQARTTGKDDPTVMFDTVWEWVDKAFGVAGGKAIRKRIDDEKDPLDLPHLMELMEKVTEGEAENPTSSSPA
jgi:hypothetical protein